MSSIRAQDQAGGAAEGGGGRSKGVKLGCAKGRSISSQLCYVSPLLVQANEQLLQHAQAAEESFLEDQGQKPCFEASHTAVRAAQYTTWLLMKLTLKGVVFSFLFCYEKPLKSCPKIEWLFCYERRKKCRKPSVT